MNTSTHYTMKQFAPLPPKQQQQQQQTNKNSQGQSTFTFNPIKPWQSSIKSVISTGHPQHMLKAQDYSIPT